MTVDVLSGGDTSGVERVADALEDDACRAIVSALEEPMSAQRVAEAADVPLSTTYRKLDKLTDASLVEERTEVRPDGHHRSRYVVDFERIILALDEERDFEVDVERPAVEPDERLADMWSEVRRET
ncbi:helix-turn-helix domain-containing protein [Halorarum halobium]|uniref:helix-turn-helix domain-containing protein n=1 Tax=Halorarum halobium TaxID=3075121 RepID=UPI0028A81600|nr:helix-turn-helix domain-containing protein [Halobaculum sp. XH14]